jgi:hypothetical protein
MMRHAYRFLNWYRPLFISMLIIILAGFNNLIISREEIAESSNRGFIQRGSLFVHANPENNFEIEISNPPDSQYSPTLTLSKFRENCHLQIDLQSANSSSHAESDTLRVSSPYMEHRLFMKTESDFEWEIVLDQQPNSNILTFPIATENLVFYYQDPDTFEAHREDWQYADNVPGSYAVYSKRGKDNQLSGGKIFHLYRPQAGDSRGESCWCDLTIDSLGGTMEIIVSSGFLDSAKYPVIIDPTFGYTTRGSSGMSLDLSKFRHHVDYGGHQDADGSMLTAYICGYRITDTAICSTTVIVYSHDSNLSSCYKVASSARIGIIKTASGPDSAAWFSAPISGVLLDSLDYIVSWQGYEDCDYCLRVCGDYTGNWGDEYRLGYEDWGTNATLSGYTPNAYRYSVYVEYQDTSGAENSGIRPRKLKRSQ